MRAELGVRKLKKGDHVLTHTNRQTKKGLAVAMTSMALI